jgi:transposase InsO family protein
MMFKPRIGRFFVKTTDSSHHFRLYPNLLKGADVWHPEQFWVADTTAIKVQGVPYYLALVCDAYSRKVMGWAIQDKNTGTLTCKALLAANMVRLYGGKITHHSDRGIQYCCGEYRMLMYKLGMDVSTTETGDPRENAIMERAIRTLKYEYGLNRNFINYKLAVKAIQYAIYAYNHLRIHFSCNLITPAMQHLKAKSSPFFA